MKLTKPSRVIPLVVCGLLLNAPTTDAQPGASCFGKRATVRVDGARDASCASKRPPKKPPRKKARPKPGPPSTPAPTPTAPLPSCAPSLANDSNPPAEGPTDFNLDLHATGELKAVMIFVDFPDAPASETTSSLYDLLVPNAVHWYGEVSYGRLSLNVTPLQKWFRMPRPSTAYSFARGLSFDDHRAYIADAVAASDQDIDFSRYQIVYVVASKDSAVPLSPAFRSYAGSGVAADGSEVLHAVTFGADIREARQDYGAHIVIHETGHLFGLPDLYEVQIPELFESLRTVGGWDPMSWVAPGAHFLAWQKWKLGWLDPSQIACLTEAGSLEATVTPLESPGGLKAVVISTAASTAYVVEVRRPIGEDSRLCDKGVLVYTVDATVASGFAPVRIKPAQSGFDLARIVQCGPLYDAAFDVGSKFREDGVSVEVLSASGNDYRLRVTRT